MSGRFLDITEIPTSLQGEFEMQFFVQVWRFLKEVMLFGVEVFVMATAREVGRRFWLRLKERGAAIAVLEAPKETAFSSPGSRVVTNSQSSLPFLDEYTD